MHPFQILMFLFALGCIAALVLMLRWERSYFTRLGKPAAWAPVRLATIPIAVLAALVVIIPARATSGMEAMAVFYLLFLTVVPVIWFGGHWIVGKFVKPALTFRESALLAATPIALCIGLALLAHQLQTLAWTALRSAGIN